MSKPKQTIVVRKDLGMRAGKTSAQVAHASLSCILGMMKENVPYYDDDNGPIWKTKRLTYEVGSALDLWLSEKFTKTVVRVDSETELLEIYEKAKDAGLPCSLIKDSGDTVFNEPTYTTVGIGPDDSVKIDAITGHLKLL